MSKEPSDAAMFAARLAKAYPTLSAYSAASLAHELCAIERAQRRHAERACSGEDGGYTKRMVTGRSGVASEWNSYAIVHDPVAEERAAKRVAGRVLSWACKVASRQGLSFDDAKQIAQIVTLEHDPSGRVLLLQLPGEADAS